MRAAAGPGGLVGLGGPGRENYVIGHTGQYAHQTYATGRRAAGRAHTRTWDSHRHLSGHDHFLISCGGPPAWILDLSREYPLGFVRLRGMSVNSASDAVPRALHNQPDVQATLYAGFVLSFACLAPCMLRSCYSQLGVCSVRVRVR